MASCGTRMCGCGTAPSWSRCSRVSYLFRFLFSTARPPGRQPSCLAFWHQARSRCRSCSSPPLPNTPRAPLPGFLSTVSPCRRRELHGARGREGGYRRAHRQRQELADREPVPHRGAVRGEDPSGWHRHPDPGAGGRAQQGGSHPAGEPRTRPSPARLPARPPACPSACLPACLPAPVRSPRPPPLPPHPLLNSRAGPGAVQRHGAHQPGPIWPAHRPGALGGALARGPQGAGHRPGRGPGGARGRGGRQLQRRAAAAAVRRACTTATGVPSL